MLEESIKANDTMQASPDVAEAEKATEETVKVKSEAVEEKKNRKDKKKKNKHAFLEKHPVAYVLLHILWAVIFVEGLGAVVFGTIFEAFGLPMTLGAVIGGLIYLACHAKRYKPEYVGNFKGGNNALGFRLATFMAIYWAYIFIQTFTCGEFAAPNIETISNALMAGVAEEVIFRLIPVSCFMRQWRDEKKIPIVLAISAITFGLIHLANIKSGAPIPITIMQVVGAGLMGVIFCAVYLRSGNILIPMLMHFITDFVCFMDSTQVGDGGVMIAKISFINFVDVAVCMVLAVIGIYLVRPAKRAEIIALWDKKFSRNEISNS